MFSAGAVIGVAIGGTIINNFGWHATFFLVIPIAIALFVSFGGDAFNIANVQLPYMAVSLIVSIASGFIVSKFGNHLPTVLGIVLSIVGFFLIYYKSDTPDKFFRQLNSLVDI